jgi:hypothetical protein
MGTRSITRIYNVNDMSKITRRLRPLVAIYRQMDGYPSGMGKILADFLKGITIINGISGGMRAGTHANGAGCFAAQLVGHLKEGIGGIYIHPTNGGDEEYNYHIYIPDCNSLGSPIQVKVVDWNRRVIFRGNVSEFVTWVATQS